MRFFATRQTESRDPLLSYACRRPSGGVRLEPWGYACGAGAGAAAGVDATARSPRGAFLGPSTAASTTTPPPPRTRNRGPHSHTYSPPLPRALYNSPREKRPRLPQQIQLGIELPPDALDDGDGHDSRREVGFQSNAVPPARR